MAQLFNEIGSAVREERYLISFHADERCEERSVTAWQIVSGLEEARLVEERHHTKPNASVVVRQILADGTEVEVVWSWLARSRRAKLVTVYFSEP